MTPYTIMNYYPNYDILDNIVSRKNYEKLNLFIDLKNTIQSVYMEHCIKHLVDSTEKSKYIDTSVFASLIPFLAFHKLYAAKRGIDVNFYIFFETGESYYHKNINKQYKKSRKLDNLYGLDHAQRQKFTEILHANYKLIDKALNKIPDTKVIKLQNLEADFIPYYLITRNKVDPNAANIIYSNDHDMWQCVTDNTFIYSKTAGKVKNIIEEGKPIKRLLKNEHTELSDPIVPLAMSVMGDSGDDISGIKGIGPKTFEKIGSDLLDLVGGMDQLRENIVKRRKVFDDTVISNCPNKNLRKVVESELNYNTISNNMKQIDFEIISRFIEDPINTSMLEFKKYIDSIISDDNISSFDSLRRALILNRVFLQEEHLELLYWRKSQGSVIGSSEHFDESSV